MFLHAEIVKEQTQPTSQIVANESEDKLEEDRNDQCKQKRYDLVIGETTRVKANTNICCSREQKTQISTKDLSDIGVPDVEYCDHKWQCERQCNRQHEHRSEELANDYLTV